MEKKKAIKLVTATAIAASAITAVAPAQSEAATSLTSQIKTAKATIKKPYDTYVKATKKPASASTVKTQITAAKKAKVSINAAIKKAKLTTKQKNAYYAQIKAYDVYITRAQNYVNVLSISVAGARTQLTTEVNSGSAINVVSKQAALNAKIKEFEKAVAKVYGKATRTLLISYYATPAKKQAASVNAEVKVYSVYKQIESQKLITTDLANAGQLIESVKAEVAKLRTQDSTLAKNLIKSVDKNNALYEKALNPIEGVNTAELDKAIAAFDSVKEEEYTIESYTAYKTTVDAAKAVKAKENATQVEVDDATKAANDSKTALVKKTVEEVTIKTTTAIAANDLAALLGAVEYNVEGTVAGSANVDKVEVTFSNGADSSDAVPATVTGATYKVTVAATELIGNYNKATVKVTYKDGSTKQAEQSFTVTTK